MLAAERKVLPNTDDHTHTGGASPDEIEPKLTGSGHNQTSAPCR